MNLSRCRHYVPTGLIGAICCLATLACGDDPATPEDPDTGRLIVNASSRPPQPLATRAESSSDGPVGDPASLNIGLFSFHISANADCSPPFVTAFNSGASALVKDFTLSPELFRAEDVPTGTYPCVAMRISDILEFESAVTAGACVVGITYRGDIYRAGGEDEPFRDLNLAVIIATGSDAMPSEDGIFILFSMNRAGTIARGFAANQVITLSSALVVPDAITFSWDATNAVIDDGDRCLFEPDAPALFR